MSNIGNYYGTLANQQQNANMQSHMRGYDLSQIDPDAGTYEELRKLILYTKFKNFIVEYFDYIHVGEYRDFERDDRVYTINQLAEHMNVVNEKVLNKPDFLNNNEMKIIAEKTHTNQSHGAINSYEKMTVYYDAGRTVSEPNTIRVYIEYINYIEKTIYKTIIDYNSDGSLIINDSEKYSYDEFKYIEENIGGYVIKREIDQSNYKEKSVVTIENAGLSVSNIERTNDYIQRIFELSGLKTEKTSHRR